MSDWSSNLGSPDLGMRQPPADHLGEEVARPPVGGIAGDRERSALSAPIGRKVGHAAMIDIAIGAPQLPILRIGSKIGTHVGVYKGLQVGAERIAEGADHDVGAHALRAVDIAVREAEDAISGRSEEHTSELQSLMRI